MLNPIADGLWTVDMTRKLLGMNLGGRMTVVRLPDRRLVLISPVRLAEEDVTAIRALGEVAWVIAPNKMHYLFLPAAKALFPSARALTAVGLKHRKPELPSDEELGPERRFEFSEVLAHHQVGGLALNEVVFLHRPSRTLIVTDLFFRFLRAPLPLRLYLKWTDGFGKLAQTQILRRYVRDQAAFRASRDVILGWDFDRVIVTHGEIQQTGGKDAARAAMAWAG